MAHSVHFLLPVGEYLIGTGGFCASTCWQFTLSQPAVFSSDHSKVETRGFLLGKRCGPGVPALFGMHDFAEASAKSANRMKVLASIASQKPVSTRWPNRTGRMLTFPPDPGSRLFCIGNMNGKLKSRVRINYHPILWGSFLGWPVVLSLARTTGEVNATGGCSCSCLFHSLWSVDAAARMLPRSPAPVLLPPYISRGCKRNQLEISHNEHTLSTAGRIKGNLVQ